MGRAYPLPAEGGRLSSIPNQPQHGRRSGTLWPNLREQKQAKEPADAPPRTLKGLTKHGAGQRDIDKARCKDIAIKKGEHTHTHHVCETRRRKAFDDS